MLEIFTEIIEDLEAIPGENKEGYFKQEGHSLFKHISENRTLYLSIFDSIKFSRKLRDQNKGIVQEHLNNHVDQFSSTRIPLEAAAQHMVSSLLGLIDWWLHQKQPYSIEKMAMIYEQLIIKATWQALGVEEINPH